MAITSTGYDGSITETQWARLVPLAGSSHYGVKGVDDWKVTPQPTLDRGLTVNIGTGWGHGVLDDSSTTVSLQGAVVASGIRWDLVVARRNWSGTGGSTTFVLVPGSSVKSIPTRNVQPGVIDDQPIALVQFSAGSTAATSIVDLRCWGRNGGMVAKDSLALTYLKEMGAQVKIGATLWSCIPDASGQPMWSAGSADGYISVFGPGTAIAGGAPPNGDLLVQAGSSVGVTDAAGYCRVVFPKPFPNGLLTVVLINGDTSVDRAYGRGNLQMAPAGQPWDFGNKTQVSYAVSYPTGMAVGLNHRVNWIAYGW